VVLYASDLLDLSSIPETATITSYQWYSDGAAIDGETADSFTVTTPYVGTSITVTVSYFVPITLYASNLLDLSGVAEGTTITYQWYANGTPINGATSSFFVVTVDYSGVPITVSASYDGTSVGSDPVTTDDEEENSPPETVNDLTPTVEVSGVFEEGETLTVSHDITDPDGIQASYGTHNNIGNGNTVFHKENFEYAWPDVDPDAEFDPFVYQWYLNGTAISGADQKTFLIPTGEGYPASSISASVTYTDLTNDTSDVFTSIQTPIRAFPTGAIVISGLLETSRTLTANVDTIQDLNGLPSTATYQYQWYYVDTGADAQDPSDDTDVEIAGATSKTYVVAEEYYDKDLKVRVTYTDFDGYTETLLSAPVHIENIPTTGTLQIDGTPEESYTLTINTDNLVDSNGIDTETFTYTWYRENEQFPILVASDLLDFTEVPQNASYEYQWYADGAPIASYGTNSQYSVTPAEIGADITVEVTYTYPDPQNPEAELTGTLTSSPLSFSIPLQESELTTYSTHSVSWEVGTEKTYLVTADDVEHTLRIYVTYTDLEGNQEPYTATTRNSVLTATKAIVDSQPVGVPVIVINTDAEQGSTLTADISGVSDINGIDTDTIEYLWSRSGTPGQTSGNVTFDSVRSSSDYVVSIADVGQNLTVRMTYTDLLGNTYQLTSDPLTIPDSQPQNLPFIEGTMRVDDPISANPFLITDRNYVRDLAGVHDPVNTIGTFTLVHSLYVEASVPVVGFRYTGRSPDFWQEHPSGTKVEAFLNDAWVIVFNGSAGEYDYRFFHDPLYASQWRITHTKGGRSIQTSGFQLVTPQDATEFGSFSYQWKSDGVGIPEATEREYVIGEDYYNTNITVDVSYYDGLNNLYTVESPARIVDARGFPTIDGVLEVGLTATANTSALEDLEGVGALSYQWMYKAWDAEDYVDIAGETNSTLVIPAGFEGALLKVRVSYNDLGNGDFETATTRDADARGVRHDVEGSIVLSRTSAVVGDFVIADTAGFLDKNGRATPADTTYSWYRDGALFFSQPTSAVYTRKVTVSNEGEALTDYLVEIILDTATLISQGKMRSDSAIRVLDANRNVLSYWLEGPTNSNLTSYWVKIPTLPAASTDPEGNLEPGTAELFVQYTSEVSFESLLGTSTGMFLFIDEFNADLDPAVWDTTNSNFTVEDGNLVGTNTSYYLRSVQKFNTPVSVRAIVNNTVANTNGITPIGFWNSTSDQFTALLHQNVSYFRNNANWSSARPFDGSNVGDVKWEIQHTTTQARFIATRTTNPSFSGATYTSEWVDNGLLNNPEGEPLFLGPRGDLQYPNQTYAAQWSVIHVRPYIEGVTITLGEEEDANVGVYQFRGGEADKDVIVRVSYEDQHGYQEAVLSDPISVANTPLTGTPTIDGTPEQTLTLTANVSEMADPDLDQDWSGETNGLVFFADAGRTESFRQGNTAWYDLSGNVNHATLTNVAPDSANTIIAGAEGVGTSKIRVSSNRESFMRNSFTHSAWVKFSPHTSTGFNGLFWAEGAYNGGGEGVSGRQLLLGVNNPTVSGGSFSYRIQNVTSGWGNTTTVSIGVALTEGWHHIAWTFDNGTTTIYFDGQEFHKDETRGEYDGGTTADFLIGSRGDGSYAAAAEYLNVLCYDRALSAEEVAANYAIDQDRFFADGKVQTFFEQSMTYEWRRDGVPIVVDELTQQYATTQQYLVVAADVYTNLTVNVSYTDVGGVSASLTTDPIYVYNSPPEGQLLIFGVFEVGETVGVETSLLSDKNGLPNEFEYQWYRRDVEIPGATSAFLTLTEEDLIKITVRTSYIDGVGERQFVSKDYWPDSGLSQSEYLGYFDDDLAFFDISLPEGSNTLQQQNLLADFDANDANSISNGVWTTQDNTTEALFISKNVFGFVHTFTGFVGISDYSTRQLSWTIPADEGGTISSITARVTIYHSFIGDLYVTLIGPDGTTRVIHNRGGGAADNLFGTYDVTSTFQGKELAGTWTLRVYDGAGGDTGSIQGLELEGFFAAPESIQADASTVTYDQGEQSLSFETAVFSDQTSLEPANALSVELFAYQQSWAVSGRQDLFRHFSSGYGIYLQNSTIYAYLRLGSNTRTLSYNVASLAGWHAIALTFDGQRMSLAIDGAIQRTYAEDSPISINYDQSKLLMGGYSGYLWQGRLSQLRVHSQALTREQLLENFNYDLSNNSTKTTSLVARYNLLSGASTTTEQIQNFSTSSYTSYLWLGYFLAPYTGTYTFYTNSSDASYFWIGDNALTPTIETALVNNGGTHAAQEVSAEIQLTTNTYYPVRLVYGQDGSGTSTMTFSFKGTFALSQLDIEKTTNGVGYFFGGQYISNVLNDSPPTGQPVIVGSPEEGQTLSVDVSGISEPDGLPNDFYYQWYKDNAEIYLANRATYAVLAEDIDSDIHVVVSYIDNGGVSTFVTSPAVTVFNSPPAGSVTISGTPKSGNTLFAETTTLTDPNDLGILSFQWYRDNAPIEGETNNSYALVVTDAGSSIFARVQYTDGVGKLETIDSAPILILTNEPTGTVTFSGRAQVGYTLTGFASLDDADGLGDFSYNWLRNGQAIENATELTYTLTADDANAAIRFQVSYVDGGNTLEVVQSLPETVLPPPEYHVLPAAASSDEGVSLTVTLQAKYVDPGDTYYWSLFGIDSADVTDGILQGSGATGPGDTFSFALAFTADGIKEGTEVLVIRMYADEERTQELAFGSVDILDTSDNTGPVLAGAQEDVEVYVDNDFSLSFVSTLFTDVNISTGDVLSYTTGQLPSWLSFDSATRTFSGTPRHADIGTSTIELTASDAAGETATTSFSITVKPRFADSFEYGWPDTLPDADYQPVFATPAVSEGFSDVDGWSITVYLVADSFETSWPNIHFVTDSFEPSTGW
jgi:subtilisin-like proprotein convertase family protein